VIATPSSANQAPDLLLSSEIRALLGIDRITSLSVLLNEVHEVLISIPERGSQVRHVPIRLNAKNTKDAEKELVALLAKSSPDWFIVTGSKPDGSHVGFASDMFMQEHSNPENDICAFAFYDIESCLKGWFLSHTWRAHDLVTSAEQGIVEWNIISAAACSRSLLEGIAAFVIEGEDMISEWSTFAKKGCPTLTEVSAFRDLFSKRLLQAQLGSRLGERGKNHASKIKRTNVLSLLERLEKKLGVDIWTPYEWLCDAVHPSFGFGTIFVATQGHHETGAIIATDLAHHVDKVNVRMPKIEPTVALAVCDSLRISMQALLAEIPRIRWLLTDMALVALSGHHPLQEEIYGYSATSSNDQCPCGSGRNRTDCHHEWGNKQVAPPEFKFQNR
jgi:hypothetical protein